MDIKTVIDAFSLLLPSGLIVFMVTVILRFIFYKRSTESRSKKRKKMYLFCSIIPAPLVGLVAGFAMLPVIADRWYMVEKATLINTAYIALAFTYLAVTIFELAMIFASKSCSKKAETE